MIADLSAPYPGPRPFRPSESDRFFGRAAEARQLVALMQAHPVVLLYAPSGTGKSSLINAGLVPRLLTEEEFEVFPIGTVRGAVPDDPARTERGNVFVTNLLSNWARELGERRRVAAEAVRPPALRKAERRPGKAARWSTIPEFLRARERPTTADGFPAERAVIIDQFEELLTLHPERWAERDEFFGQLSQALEADELLHVLLVIRDDYLAQIERYLPLLPDGVPARFRLDRLTGKAALRAVTGPLDDHECEFAPGVAEQLVADLMKLRVDDGRGGSIEVPGEFVEPVQLQLACASLWSALPHGQRTITTAHLRDFGNLDQILARFYNEAIDAAARASERTVEHLRVWFEETFITSLGTRGTVLRTRNETAGVPNIVLDTLEERHLIRAEYRAGARWYELTHDRFIEPTRASNRAVLRQPAGWGDRDELRRDANFLLARAEEARLEDRLDDAAAAAQQAHELSVSMGDHAGAANARFKLAEIDADRGERAGLVAHARAAHDDFLAADDDLAAADALRGLAERLHELGDITGALDVLEEASRAYRRRDRPDHVRGAAKAELAISMMEWELGEWGQAVEHADKARELCHRAEDGVGEGRAEQLLAELHGVAGRPEDSLEHARRAVAIHRESDSAWDVANALGSLARVQLDQLQFDAALQTSREMLALARRLGDAAGTAVARSYVAGAQLGEGQSEAAIETLSPAVALDPDLPILRRQRACAYWTTGRLREAALDLEHLLAAEPEDPIGRSLRGLVFAEQRDPDRALEDLNRALELLTPKDSDWVTAVRCGRGLALAQRGQPDAAADEFAQVLTDAPDHGWAYFYRGLAREHDGDPALDDFQRALDARAPSLPASRRRKAQSRLERQAKAA
jgi:tetratricopeptide (TPR) repeat protein